MFSNAYDGNFSDAKIAGVELIHHGVRTATNGDVRLSPTPEQWDPVPALKSRQVSREGHPGIEEGGHRKSGEEREGEEDESRLK